MEKMHFTKMQGLGNDYLYVYGEVPGQVEELCRRLSDRHFGAGSDGMIFISPSDKADFRMRIFNADGSEARMCGNGIRCVGKYVYEKGYTQKTELNIETLSGIRRLSLILREDRVEAVEVDMGQTRADEPLLVRLDGSELQGVPVSVGNPHIVFFVPDIGQVPLEVWGPQVEKHRMFPGRINAEFVQVLSGRKLRMRAWERGSGITMACGTGACAAAAAAVKAGYCAAGQPVKVELDGGELGISVDGQGNARMTGPAEFVYEGETV